jgi:tRNA A-37 threonylcarbamoyl transferase component Bud32
MSNESLPKCPQCGQPLAADAPGGLCPNCLMALNLQTVTDLPDERVAAQPPQTPEQIGQLFPQLEVLECLGRGGMGVVYKARQKSLNRLVALKLLAPERVRDAKFAERFTREAQALAALSHPNIVTIHDFGQAGGFYYLIMEFVDGLNLRQLLRARKLTPEEALAIVPPLCDALQFAHDRGIVHRDIKPENLLLDKAGRIKVADFGIAKIMGGENGERIGAGHWPAGAPALTEADNTVGTPGYSAPEQKTDPQRVDSRADIYSLGVVFYEMLTGELPGDKIAPPSTKVHIDVRLDEIVLRALEQKPELRYQQASVLKTQVETIVGTESHAQPALPAKTPAVRAYESFFGITFTSRAAITTGNLSMLGLLGLLGMLGEIPGLEGFRGAYGFFGFFGLLGVAFGIERPGSRTAGKSPTSGTPPELSSTAIVGVSWIAFFVVAACLWIAPHSLTHTPTRWASVLGLFFTVPGALAPFGVTILGWVAVTQIRRSAGKISGMRLAVFDGALFPLLAIDLVIYLFTSHFQGIWIMALRESGANRSSEEDVTWWIFTIFAPVTCGLVDLFIIRWVWRAVNKPVHGSPTLTATAPAEKSEVGNQQSEIAPQLSRTAIAGASSVAWAVIALVWFSILSGEGVTPWKNMTHPERLGFVLTEFIGLAGWLSPFATTMFGWIAVRQIRRSAGKLQGMPLAVFDLLLFPLIALCGLFLLVRYVFFPPYFQGFHLDSIFAAAGIGVDILVIRGVWRAVNKPADGATPPEGPARPSSTVLASREKPWRMYGAAFLKVLPLGVSWCLCRVFLVPELCHLVQVRQMIRDQAANDGFQALQRLVLDLFGPNVPEYFLFVCLAIAIGEGLLPAWRRHRRTALFVVTASLNTLVLASLVSLALVAVILAGAARQPATTSFGPAVERVITVGNDAHSFYSFDRNDYVPGPMDFDPADVKNNYKLWKWMTEHHVDLFARTRDGHPILVRSEMITVDLNEDDFDGSSVPELEANPQWEGEIKAQSPRAQESSTLNRGNLRGNRDTFLFQNRYEVVGAVQALGITSDPPGVKIRYKLVQPGSQPPAAPAAAPSPNPTFGSVVERVIPISHGFSIMEFSSGGYSFESLASSLNNQTISGDAFLSFATGQIIAAPSDLPAPGRYPKAFEAWLDSNDADAIAVDSGGWPRLWCFGCTLLQVRSDRWDNFDAKDAAGELQAHTAPNFDPNSTAFTLNFASDGSSSVAQLPKTLNPAALPACFLLKTRRGAIGLMQVEDLSKEGVKVRYKMAQSTSQPAVPPAGVPSPQAAMPAANSAAKASFGPVLERELPDRDRGAQDFLFFSLAKGEIVRPPFPVKFTSLAWIGQPPDGLSFIEITPQLKEWARAQRVDLVFCFEKDRWHWQTLEARSRPDFDVTKNVVVHHPETFDTIDPEAALRRLAGPRLSWDDPKMNEYQDNAFVTSVATFADYSTDTGPVLFQTRDKTAGVMDIQADPAIHGVRIRWKLVQNEGAGSIPPSENRSSGYGPEKTSALPAQIPIGTFRTGCTATFPLLSTGSGKRKTESRWPFRRAATRVPSHSWRCRSRKMRRTGGSRATSSNSKSNNSREKSPVEQTLWSI